MLRPAAWPASLQPLWLKLPAGVSAGRGVRLHCLVTLAAGGMGHGGQSGGEQPVCLCNHLTAVAVW